MLSEVKIDTSVDIKGILLVKVSYMNFMDFNLQDANRFPSLQFPTYVEIIEEPDVT